jgi:hypothetical protein
MNARAVGVIEFNFTQALKWVGVRLLVYFSAALLGAATFFVVGNFYARLNPLPVQTPRETPKQFRGLKEKDESNRPKDLVPFESKDIQKIIGVPVAKLPEKKNQEELDRANKLAKELARENQLNKLYRVERRPALVETQESQIVLLSHGYNTYLSNDRSLPFAGVPIYDSNNQSLGEIEVVLSGNWVVVDVKKSQYTWLPHVFMRSTGWGVDYKFAVQAQDITWTWENASGQLFTNRNPYSLGGYTPGDFYLDSADARISWLGYRPIKGVAPITKGEIENTQFAPGPR